MVGGPRRPENQKARVVWWSAAAAGWVAPPPLRPKCEHCDYYDYNCDDYHYTTATATVAAAAATAMTTTTTATTTELCETVGVVAPAKFTTGILT